MPDGRPRLKPVGDLPRRWTCPACRRSVRFENRWAHIPTCRGRPWTRAPPTGDRVADLRRDTVTSLARADFYIARYTHRAPTPEDRERRERWIQNRERLREALDGLDGVERPGPPRPLAEWLQEHVDRLVEISRHLDRQTEDLWAILDAAGGPGDSRRPPWAPPPPARRGRGRGRRSRTRGS